MNSGELIAEGKTKKILTCNDRPENTYVLLKSKDAITANNAQRKSVMKDKGVIATQTCVSVFKMLESFGVKTALVERYSEDTMLCHRCDMIPIEWVTRRVATGSFLKRNPGVKEGFRFTPPKLEIFYKDDEAGDPQWSVEQLLEAKMKVGCLMIASEQIAQMSASTVAVFEILEKVWHSRGVTLVDMKIEFGVSRDTGELLLADVIDNDSWRLWPNGDKRLQKDKQTFREAAEVNDEVMKDLKSNYQWVSDQLLKEMKPKPHKVVIVMGSASDADHSSKIQNHLADLGVISEVRICSAHKAPDRTLQILAEYEGLMIPIVVIAVAGRSNGLGPVMSGNTQMPVINCPPLSSSMVADSDVWSSLRTPSGLGCSTVLYPETAALAAASILAATGDPAIWSRLRAKRLNNWLRLVRADEKWRKTTP